jgi:hypothetical protein
MAVPVRARKTESTPFIFDIYISLLWLIESGSYSIDFELAIQEDAVQKATNTVESPAGSPASAP